MKRVPLADTLTALIQAVEPPEQSGLRVMEAEFDLPLEVFATVADGRLVLHAAPPVHALAIRRRADNPSRPAHGADGSEPPSRAERSPGPGSGGHQ